MHCLMVVVTLVEKSTYMHVHMYDDVCIKSLQLFVSYCFADDIWLQPYLCFPCVMMQYQLSKELFLANKCDI